MTLTGKRRPQRSGIEATQCHPAAAGPGSSEHRNVDIPIPVARQREIRACPHVPCERRTGPAERDCP